MTRKLLLCVSLVLLGCDENLAEPDLETEFERKLAEHNRMMASVDLDLGNLVIRKQPGDYFCTRRVPK